MQKDFDRWNKTKKEVNNENSNFYHVREIRWCSLGVNVGFEQDGRGKDFQRPVLVVKGFSRNVCLVVPLTTSKKKNPYHIDIGSFDNKENFVILSQIRLIDTRRLNGRLGILGQEKFEEIRKAIRDLI